MEHLSIHALQNRSELDLVCDFRGYLIAQHLSVRQLIMQCGQVTFVNIYIYIYPSHFNCEWVRGHVQYCTRGPGWYAVRFRHLTPPALLKWYQPTVWSSAGTTTELSPLDRSVNGPPQNCFLWACARAYPAPC